MRSYCLGLLLISAALGVSGAQEPSSSVHCHKSVIEPTKMYCTRQDGSGYIVTNDADNPAIDNYKAKAWDKVYSDELKAESAYLDALNDAASKVLAAKSSDTLKDCTALGKDFHWTLRNEAGGFAPHCVYDPVK